MNGMLPPSTMCFGACPSPSPRLPTSKFFQPLDTSSNNLALLPSPSNATNTSGSPSCDPPTPSRATPPSRPPSEPLDPLCPPPIQELPWPRCLLLNVFSIIFQFHINVPPTSINSRMSFFAPTKSSTSQLFLLPSFLIRLFSIGLIS